MDKGRLRDLLIKADTGSVAEREATHDEIDYLVNEDLVATMPGGIIVTEARGVSADSDLFDLDNAPKVRPVTGLTSKGKDALNSLIGSSDTSPKSG